MSTPSNYHPIRARGLRFAKSLAASLLTTLVFSAGAAELTVILEVQRSDSLEGPWLRTGELEVPAVESQGFYRIALSPGAGFTIAAGFVWIPDGTFLMGTPDSEIGRRTAEGPQTQVRLPDGFWMSRHETTQREWESVMGSNPSVAVDPDLPVESVGWDDAMEYCAKLTVSEREAGRLPPGYVYRLPSEAEWEYACRAGTTGASAFGDSLSSTNANFDGVLPYGGAAIGPLVGRTVKGGSYPANAWGLHDMHGNVWEWCMDWYPSRLPGGRSTNPVGAGLARHRALRGGAWHNDGGTCRSGFRYLIGPIFRTTSSGLRPVIAKEI